MKRATSWAAAVAFIVSICVPVGRPLPIVGALGLASLASLAKSLSNRSPVPQAVFPALGLAVLGVLQVVLGAFRQNPGTAHASVALVFGPLVFVSLIWAADRRMVESIDRAILLAVPLASVQVILGALVPEAAILDALEPAANSTVVDGVSRVRSIAIGSLVGGVPYVTFRALRPQRGRTRFDLERGAFFLGSIATVLSGRAALILIWVLAVTVGIWGRAHPVRAASHESGPARRRLAPMFFGGVSVLAGARILGVSAVGSVAAAVQKMLTTTQSTGPNVRLEQIGELTSGWWENPIFGAGAGAVIDDYQRNEAHPWEFENQMLLWLFNGGLVSLVGLVWLLHYAKRLADQSLACASEVDRGTLRAAIAAALSILVANLSNPYLRAIGQQWALFLPLIVIAGTRRSPNA